MSVKAELALRRKAVRTIKRFPTLEALVRGIFKGDEKPEDVEALLDAIGLGIGLKKRDAALAQAIEDGPEKLTDDPVYAQGLVDGFQAAQRKVRNGEDILALERVDPESLALGGILGSALEDVPANDGGAS